MLVKCIRNQGSALGAPSTGSFYTRETVFHVSIGREYDVLGFGLYETTLLTLVLDETQKPNWLPVGLFDISSLRLPPEWRVSVFDGIAASGGRERRGWVALWGYEELVRDTRQVDALVDRDPAALERFSEELARERATRP